MKRIMIKMSALTLFFVFNQTENIYADQNFLQSTTNNFLGNLSVNAESASVQLSFVYSNNGVLTPRTIYATVPAGFTNTNNVSTYPVCFIFHGTAKNGNGAAEKSCKDEVGSGCIIISAVGGRTDDGMYSWNANGSTKEDDLAFVRAIWAAIKNDHRINKNQVYAYGHSVGSLFVSNVLAPNVDFFKGFCCYSSQLMTTTDISTAPVPVNIVYFHGSVDNMIPAKGGPAKFDSSLVFKSIYDSVKLWAHHNGFSENIMVESNQTYKRYYVSNDNNFIVDSYIFYGVKHNSVQPVTEHFGMSAAQLALHFFAK